MQAITTGNVGAKIPLFDYGLKEKEALSVFLQA